MVLSRRRGVLVSGVFLLFALVSSHLCGFIHLSSVWLLTFRLGLWVDPQIVDNEVFQLLGFPSTSLAPSLYDCRGPLQALLVWGTPIAAEEQYKCYQFLFLLSLSQNDARQMSVFWI